MFTLFLNVLFVNADILIETQGFIYKRNLFWTDVQYNIFLQTNILINMREEEAD